MAKKETFCIDDLVKEIDLKIAELEKKETPNYLLRTALIKKKIIKPEANISDEDMEKLFTVIEETYNNMPKA